jgi:hypothetical protein
MSITCRLRRPARLCAIACALLVPATGGAAFAASDPLAQERNYWSYAYESPDSSPAQAQERYYSSYGDPEPLTSPQSSAPSDEAPWLLISLSIAGALAIAAASTTQLRRVRIRRRRAAGTPA